MHYLTSNFNLLHTNINWSSLKKKNLIIDSEYDNFYLSLINNQLIEKYKSFHIIIFLTRDNYKKTIKELKSLQKKSNKFSSKVFFFYFFKDIRFKKKILFFDRKSKLRKPQNFFFENDLQITKRDFFSSRNFSFLKFPFDISAINFLKNSINKKIEIICSKPYKLIILDCDNTLWGGVLDEDKDKEILYVNKNKKFFYDDFQKKIKKFKNNGFLISLCSKNNEKKVWKFFKKRRMALQKKDFVLSKINWKEKPDNINEIVKNLDLRFEDCIFIDDNIIEIKKVKNKLKKINTLHLENIELADKLISDDKRFNKLFISGDDLKKTKQYKLRSKFTQYISKNTIEPNLIKGLKQKIKILSCSRLNLKRAGELFNKTNQFNFSLNRYKDTEILNLMDKKNYEIRLFNLKDKFGDHGIIGAVVLKIEKKKILIEDFILSCRVLSRFAEDFILQYIFERFSEKDIEIKYKKTNVNSNLIPIFLKKKKFNLIKKINNLYVYKIKFNLKELKNIKKIFGVK